MRKEVITFGDLFAEESTHGAVGDAARERGKSSGVRYASPKPRVPRVKTPQEALGSLMNLCARSEKSSGDALRLMRGWGVDADESRKVLAELVRQKFIDDGRYAAAYVREKTGLSGWGPRKIAQMLSAKGVSREIIAAALAQVDPEASAGRLAEKLERKALQVKYKDMYDLKGKLVRYGLSLGYGYDDVLPAVERTVEKIKNDE